MNIALLGAESSGKSSLAQALVTRFAQDHPHLPAPVQVPEWLRTWCERHQRLPLQHEQAAVLREHADRLGLALADPPQSTRLLVADTTPLMVAVYSEHYFGDTSLYEEAWACHRRFDGTLLMGLDLPWQADGLLRDGPAVQQAVDHLLRQRLAQAGLRFATVYGTGDARAAAAWGSISALIPASSPLKNAIEKIANKFYQISAEAQFGSEKWVACENCSDPGCEHRLFSRLMAGRCA